MRIEEVHRRLAARLRLRREEIEQAILVRVYAVSEPTEATGPEYAHGLREAIAAAIDHGIGALEHKGDRQPPIPAVLLAQARLAAREGISLDTVLRRYLSGYTLLGDFVIQEAQTSGPVAGKDLQRLLRGQAAVFDRLMVAVSEEYAREEDGRPESIAQRCADRVKRLLAGELVDTSDLGYELDDHHLGVIASGHGAAEALGKLAQADDRRLLSIRRDPDTIWAWLGGRRCFEAEEIDDLVTQGKEAQLTLAIGEPGHSVSGWRHSHHQARAALPIALSGPQRVVRYADVALLASILRDDTLTASLNQLYLVPLAQERDGGEMARETLRAYFAAGRNVSSAAAALGLSRQTIASRLRSIETRLGRSLGECGAELEVGLRLQALPPQSQ